VFSHHFECVTMVMVYLLEENARKCYLRCGKHGEYKYAGLTSV